MDRLYAMHNVDFAKSILIILVVIGHSLIFWTGTWISSDIAIQAPVLGQIAIWLGTFHTPALTAISGYTYEYVFENRGYTFPDLVKKKFRRLLLPLVFVSIFWVIPLTSCVIDVDYDYIINKFALGKSPAQLWYLLMLFNVFLLFHTIRFLVDRHWFFYLIIPILYVAANVFGDTFNYFQFITSLRYLSYFALGHLLYKYRKFVFFHDKVNLRQPIILGASVVFHVVAFVLWLHDMPRTKTLLMLYLNFGGCLSAVAILLFIGEKVNPETKLMSILNRNSFAVYLLHQQMIYFTIFYFNGLICPALHAAINFVVSFTMSLALSVILRKSLFVRVCFLGEKN